MQEKLTTKRKAPPPEAPVEKEMTFWDHLEELRMHIFRSLAAIIIFAIVAFIFKGIIFDIIILAPKDSNFITNKLLCKLGELVSVEALCIGEINLVLQNINMSGQFMMHMYVSFVAGLIIAAPYVLWELWRFILPALEPKEKK